MIHAMTPGMHRTTARPRRRQAILDRPNRGARHPGRTTRRRPEDVRRGPGARPPGFSPRSTAV